MELQGHGRPRLSPSNYKRFKKGTELKYDAKNKMMFGLEYNVASDEIIFMSMKNFKVLTISFLGNKTFLLMVHGMEETGVLMRKHKQV